jgi:two-component system, OmpR family, phosphate regulon sensor histidine kinase PhoR
MNEIGRNLAWKARYQLAIACLVALCAFAASVSYALVFLIRGGSSPTGSDFLSYLAVALLSFALVFPSLILLRKSILARSRPRRRGVLSFLTEAMSKIASGDFEIGDFEISPSSELPAGRSLEEKAINRLGEMTEALKKMDEMRQDFVSNVSHEIRSPLASIRGFAQILRDDGLPPEQRRRYLEIIESESDRLTRLGDSLLKLSALDSGAQDIKRLDFRLDAQLRSVIVACEPQWRAKGISVEAELEPLIVVADKELLRQVWDNLLANAIKFTPRGGRVDLSCRAEPEDAIVAIADTGIGIAPEDIAFVFDRFFKADRSHSFAEGDGNGLGLSIAQRIVERHGGRLLVESEGLGKGACFRACIPLKSP